MSFPEVLTYICTSYQILITQSYMILCTTFTKCDLYITLVNQMNTVSSYDPTDINNYISQTCSVSTRPNRCPQCLYEMNPIIKYDTCNQNYNRRITHQYHTDLSGIFQKSRSLNAWKVFHRCCHFNVSFQKIQGFSGLLEY